MRYTWEYGIFHWFVHYFLTIMLVTFSGILIFPIFLPYTLFGYYLKNNIVDHFVVIVVSSLIDLDHLPTLKMFGRKKYFLVEKRLVSPLHNFFFLSAFSVASAFSAIFFSKVMGVLFFSIVLHMLWDIFEDVVIFKTTFRRWEKTWGIDATELQNIYNELLQIEPQEVKKESKVKKIGHYIKDRIRRKKQSQLLY